MLLYWFAKEGNIRTGQELLEHSSISVTEMVSHLSAGFKKQEIDLLDYSQTRSSIIEQV